MKTVLTLLLLSISIGIMAQRSSNKHVTTDGRQLRIRVDLEQAGQSVHYNRSFAVDGMDESAVKALENHVIDSLDRVLANQTTDIHIDRKYTDRKSTRESHTVDSDRDKTMQASASSALSPSDVMPSSVLMREDKENGRLWMQYTFEKDGEELVIERTANVIGKSEREKQAIVKETERSFGIRTGNQ